MCDEKRGFCFQSSCHTGVVLIIRTHYSHYLIPAFLIFNCARSSVIVHKIVGNHMMDLKNSLIWCSAVPHSKKLQGAGWVNHTMDLKNSSIWCPAVPHSKKLQGTGWGNHTMDLKNSSIWCSAVPHSKKLQGAGWGNHTMELCTKGKICKTPSDVCTRFYSILG